MTVTISNGRTSVRWGVTRAVGLWRVVVVVWFVGLAAFAPAVEVLGGAVGGALENLPGGSWEPPPGDVWILQQEAIRSARGPLGLALTSAVVFLWAFGALWRAGVARWEVWDGGGPRGPGRVFGLGLGAWFAWIRLSLTGVVVFVVAAGLVVTVVSSAVASAFSDAAEGRAMVAVGVGLLVAAVAKMVVWAAGLRGAWELARPRARSAVLAWLRGLAGVFLRPLSTFGPIVVLGLPAVALTAAPLALGLAFPALRTGVPGFVATAVPTLLASWAGVALYESYAPLSEVAGPVE